MFLKLFRAPRSKTAAFVGLCLALHFGGAPAFLFASQSSSSVGPRSQAEAIQLWNQGKQSYEKGDYADSVRDLQRFIDRYPGAEGYLEAHLLLGTALLKTGAPSRAVAPLRYVTGASKIEAQLAQARLLLARAYVESGRHQEGYLGTIEIEKKHANSEQVQSEALLIRARALAGLNQDQRAAKSLASAKTLGEELKKELKAEAAWLELHLKTRACGRFPGRSPMNEEQVRDQIARRGQCLAEALLLFRAVLESGEAHWTQESRDEMKVAFAAYWRACENPPPQPPRKPKQRTAIETKRYREELVAFLKPACRSAIREQVRLLPSSESELSSYLLELIGEKTQ